MNKFSTQVRAIFLALIFFLVVPATAQEYQFRPDLWKRKAQQVHLHLVDDTTVSGLLVFVDKEGLMLIPKIYSLGPTPTSSWNPQYIGRDSIVTLTQELQFQAKVWGILVGLGLPVVGYIRATMLGDIVPMFWGFVAGPIIGPLTAISVQQLENLSNVTHAREPVSWWIFRQNAHRHTLVLPSNVEDFLALIPQLNTDTANWDALRNLSPARNPGNYTWGVETSLILNSKTLSILANEIRLSGTTRRGVNIAGFYNLTPAWRLESGIGTWKDANIKGYYNWDSPWYSLSGNALNTRIHSNYGYLVGKWHTNLAKTPIVFGLGAGVGLERIRYDIYSSLNSVGLDRSFDPIRQPSEERVETFFLSHQFYPGLITAADLGYARSNWEIFLGYFAHWLPRIDLPGYRSEHDLYDPDFSMTETIIVEPSRKKLSRIDMRIGLRFSIR